MPKRSLTGPPTHAQRSETVTLSGTVESIDVDQRLFRVRDGRTAVVFRAGPQVRNFGELQVGDRITLDYFESVAVGMADPNDPCGPNDDFHPFTTADRFNFGEYNLVLTPSERWNIFGKVHKDITDNVTAHLRGSFARRESNNTVAPEPIFIGSGAGTGGLPDTISIDVTNPYNPFGFSIVAPDDPNYFLGRRPVEYTARSFDQSVDTWSMAAGLDGAFDAWDRSFYWDANGIWSKNTADQLKRGAINAAKLQRGLGPVDECSPDGRDANGNFIPGPDGCVPVNLGREFFFQIDFALA